MSSVSDYRASKVKPTKDRLAELDSLGESVPYAVNMNSAWLGRYIECFHCQGSAFILESRAGEGGALAGALPLEVRGIQAGPGWRLRRLVPLSTGPADFSPILCLPGREAEVAASLSGWLVSHSQQWDSFRIDLIPQSSRGWREFVHALRESGFSPEVSQKKCFYKVDTRGSWEAHQKGFLGGHLDTLRNLRNRLGRERGPAEVVMMDQGIEDYLEGFLTCYRRRRQAKGEKDPFVVQPERLPFLLCVVRDFEQSHKARLSMLRSEKEILAYQLDWLDGGIWYYYHPTFDDRYAHYSPGRILLLETLRIAFEDPQVREFNFMRGDEAYKTQFANQTESYVSLRTWNRWSRRVRATAYYSRLAALLERLVRRPRNL